jgi:hypothetical protein
MSATEILNRGHQGRAQQVIPGYETTFEDAPESGLGKTGPSAAGRTSSA